MPRPSPQTDRVRWIISTLAASPRQPLTLAQIARRLGISKATCMPSLNALTTAGWLVRHPRDKTYRLGPTLIEIGRAAELATSSTGIGPAMRELAAASGLTCLAYTASADEIVLIDLVGPDGPRAEWAGMTRGHPLQPVAPRASVLVAWAGDAAFDRWVGDIEGAAGGDQRRRFQEDLRWVRERGYVIELSDPLRMQLFQLIEKIRLEGSSPIQDLVEGLDQRFMRHNSEHDFFANELDPDRLYPAVSINAPVFDRYGAVTLILCLVDFSHRITAVEAVRLGEMVRDAASALTRAHHGVFPDGWPCVSYRPLCEGDGADDLHDAVDVVPRFADRG